MSDTPELNELSISCDFCKQPAGKPCRANWVFNDGVHFTRTVAFSKIRAKLTELQTELKAALKREEDLKSTLHTFSNDGLKLLRTKMEVDAKLFAALEREKELQARISALEQEKLFSKNHMFTHDETNKYMSELTTLVKLPNKTLLARYCVKRKLGKVEEARVLRSIILSRMEQNSDCD